jgi:predicted adenine nucleotide alpha hydrolase (AANH) superfamily ATPase
MRVLLHICCAPCATVPVEGLRKEGFDAEGYFFNPNIHPYREYVKRLEAVKKLASATSLRVIYDDKYDFTGFFRDIAFREDRRCRICYYRRFVQTASAAKHGGYDFFTSTLLISPHQDHDLIKCVGEDVAVETGVKLLYRDYRDDFRRSYELSQEYGLYRQQYCGCIHSEYERYAARKED